MTTVTFQIVAMLTGDQAASTAPRRWPPSRWAWCCSSSPWCSTSSRCASSSGSAKPMSRRSPPPHPTDWRGRDARRMQRRYAAERRFRLLGPWRRSLFSVAVLAFLLVTMTGNGVGGFQRDRTRACRSTFASGALTVDPAQLQGAERERGAGRRGAARRGGRCRRRAARSATGCGRAADRRRLARCRATADRRSRAAAAARSTSAAARVDATTWPPRCAATARPELQPLAASWQRRGQAATHRLRLRLPDRRAMRPIRSRSASGARSRARC